jgi:uncharacterized protein (DUF433 family)
MTGVNHDEDVFFGRPYVGDELDVKGLLTFYDEETDNSELIETFEDLGYEISEEDIEVAREYAKENPEEIEAIRADDKRFIEFYGPDFESEDEAESAYEEFVTKNYTNFDFLVEKSWG